MMTVFIVCLLSALGCHKPISITPRQPECMAPAKPGGGFDLTCRIVSDAFKKTGLLDEPMQVSFKPGGIGAVAMAQMTTNRRADNDVIVAFSTGSILNMAQGKFGNEVGQSSVRWLASAGTDYGAYVVRADSRWADLAALADDLRADPKGLVIGAGGTVGSQDWIKSALLFNVLELNPRSMRYVAFDGGGEATAALLGGHIDFMVTDVAETTALMGTDTVRVLAVLAPQRLTGIHQQIPTALEQGMDITWPVFRGYYLGKDVTQAQYAWWQNRFEKLYQEPAFQQIRAAKGLMPLDMSGEEFTTYVQGQFERYRQLASELELIPPEDREPRGTKP